MRFLPSTVGGVVRPLCWRVAVFAGALSICGVVAAPAASAQEHAAPASIPASAVSGGAACGSLVIRHCHVHAIAPALVVDRDAPAIDRAPPQWQVTRGAGPDADEIEVMGERIREPSLKEIFDRNLGPLPGATALVSWDAGGGARCTTISRSGATLCSLSGGVQPDMGTPVASWSLSF